MKYTQIHGNLDSYKLKMNEILFHSYTTDKKFKARQHPVCDNGLSSIIVGVNKWYTYFGRTMWKQVINDEDTYTDEQLPYVFWLYMLNAIFDSFVNVIDKKNKIIA